MSALIKSIISSRSPTDISRSNSKYKIFDYVIDDPFLFIDEYDYLKHNSEIIDFDIRYEYRPDYVSYDFYQTTNLWYLILYINDVNTIIDFSSANLNKIYVPYSNVIDEVITKKLKNKKIQSLREV